jgi:hypothetical protein
MGASLYAVRLEQQQQAEMAVMKAQYFSWTFVADRCFTFRALIAWSSQSAITQFIVFRLVWQNRQSQICGILFVSHSSGTRAFCEWQRLLLGCCCVCVCRQAAQRSYGKPPCPGINDDNAIFRFCENSMLRL